MLRCTLRRLNALVLAGQLYPTYVFVNSEDAMAARSVDPFYRDSIPSRGIAELARDFPEELRAQDARERHLLSLFGEVQTECTGRGACDYGAGECYCASRYFGNACEYTYCANDCNGHGRCNFVTSECACDRNYEPDLLLGCKLRKLYLATTTREDAGATDHGQPQPPAPNKVSGVVWLKRAMPFTSFQKLAPSPSATCRQHWST